MMEKQKISHVHYDSTQYQAIYDQEEEALTVATLNARRPWYSFSQSDWIKKDKVSEFTGATYNLSLDTLRERRWIGRKEYELTDHLGNVLVTFLDRKTGYGNSSGSYIGFNADIASITDYYPFGMPISERTIISATPFSKFGYNGQLRVDEISGAGNHNTAMFWEYNTQIARRWNLDPVGKVGISDYSVLINNPIKNFDINGDDTGKVFIPEKKWKNVYKTHLKGLAKNPDLLNSNGHVYLNYDPLRSNAQKRRREARRGIENPDPANYDVDEFPYASTTQGGERAATNLVPKSENRQHGGYLGWVVQNYNMKDGDVFDIVLIPDYDNKPKPRVVPATEVNPAPALPRNPDGSIKTIGGYPGQKIGELISQAIKWLTGKKVNVPDPVVAPIPAAAPAPIPVP